MSWKNRRKNGIDKLLDCVSQKFCIQTEDLISKSRKKELVMARKCFMNILYEHYNEDKMTQSDIANVIGRDRTSFIHHRKEHLNHYSRYKTYKEDYDSLKKEFENIMK